jgi:hypothetical protein
LEKKYYQLLFLLYPGFLGGTSSVLAIQAQVGFYGHRNFFAFFFREFRSALRVAEGCAVNTAARVFLVLGYSGEKLRKKEGGREEAFLPEETEGPRREEEGGGGGKEGGKTSCCFFPESSVLDSEPLNFFINFSDFSEFPDLSVFSALGLFSFLDFFSSPFFSFCSFLEIFGEARGHVADSQTIFFL